VRGGFWEGEATGQHRLSAWCTRGEGEEAQEEEEAPGSAAGWAREEERRRRKVEDGPDRWAQPVSRRVREKGGGPVGLNGPKVEIWAAVGRKKKRDGVCRAYTPGTHARKEEDKLLLEFPCNPTRTRFV
jgi:hypothetical protein